MNRTLDHINLKVPNLEQSIAFFTEHMGFVVTERFKQGMEFVFLSDGNVTYELLEDQTLQGAIIDHLAYVSEDIQKDYAYYEALGMTTTSISCVDFLFENGVEYFFIQGKGNEKIEFCMKR